MKADASTTYSKTDVGTSLGLKANVMTTYPSKEDVDTSLALKANVLSNYLKTEVTQPWG